MKKKHRGFTLVELMVALLCGMLIHGMMTGAAVFLTKSSNELIDGGRSLHHTKAVYDYICSLHLTDYSVANDEFSVENGILKRNGIEILSALELEDIDFASKDGFVYCELTYADRTTVSFVAGKESNS